MEERHCGRCGIKLPHGSLVYVAEVKVFADFDGVILESEEESQQSINQLLEHIKDADPEALEKEVYEEFALVLCKGCRDRFVNESLHPWEGPFPLARGSDRILH
jgi:hypothetical protein